LIEGVRALDRAGGLEVRIRAHQVLNATGPWGDAVRRLAGDDGGPLLRPTKGVHLIAPGRGLTAAFLLLHPADRRVFFVIPWLNKTLLGTTDTECDDAPDDVRVTPADVDYLLDGHNHYFTPTLGPGDVLGRFAGLRPLLRSGPGRPSDRSREYQLSWSPSGLLSVVGGKYTTYRHMAEVITDAVARRLGVARRCRTRTFRLDGAPRVAWDRFEPAEVGDLRARWGLDEEAARHLVRRYGRRAAEVAAYLGREPALRRGVVAGEPDLLAEFAYQRDEEMALFLGDFLLRRTRLGLFRPELLDRPPAETWKSRGVAPG
jgi:glycerol-3-phosphate dehydrogenase